MGLAGMSGLVRFYRPAESVKAIQFTGSNWDEIARVLRVPLSKLGDHWPLTRMEFDKDGRRIFVFDDGPRPHPFPIEAGCWLLISDNPRAITGFATDMRSWRRA
jgi:hypothetical protein